MVNSYFKHCIRKIKETVSRYFSILILVMLGIAFFTGMNSISPDMKETAIQYLNDKTAYDIQVFSPLGLTNDDITAIKSVDGIENVYPAYTIDVLIKDNDKDIAIRTNSITNDVNKIEITSGELPKALDECVVDDRMVQEFGSKVGDVIEIYSGTKDDISNSFNVTKFKVVGTIKSPIYISNFYGATNVGSGELQGSIFLIAEVFNLDVYTNAYVVTTVKEDSKLDDTFQKKVDKINRSIENIALERQTIRYKEVFFEASTEIEDGKKQITESESQIEEAKSQLEQGRKAINDAINDLCLAIGETTFVNNRKIFESFSKEFEQKKETYLQKQNKLTTLDTQINSLISGLYNSNIDTSARVETNAKLSDLNIEYQNLKTELEKMTTDLIKDNEEFQEKEKAINEYMSVANGKLANAYEGTGILEDLNSKIQDFNNKKNEFDEKSKDAEIEIEDGKKDIEDAEELLNSLDATWTSTPIYDSNGFTAFNQDLDKISIMGKVFPVMFFIVSGLVSLTAITRMIEEDRGSIGVLKALGYSNLKIMSKYVLYSLSATIIGIAIGTVIGNNILTLVLWDSYSILYSLPDLITNPQIYYLIIATYFAIFCTVVFAVIFSFKELQSKPADLIRPKTPKEGKKILLEKITPLWNKFSFNSKMMFRNIFRYKKRLFMAMLGIAGCTALIYSGFSLKSSIDAISSKQFGEIKIYDLIVNLNVEMTKEEITETLDYINKNSKIDESTYVRQKAIDIEANKKEKEVFYAVAESDELNKYILLKNRQANEEIELNDDGIIITEKISKILNIQKDDTITIKYSNRQYETIVLRGI